MSEVKAIVSAIEMFLSSQINTIGNSVLWSCLDDDVDDAILINNLGNPKPPNGIAGETNGSSVSKAFRILRLRRNILRYLQHNIIQLNSEKARGGELQHSDALSLRGISRVFHMTISLTLCLNNNGKVRKDCHLPLLFEQHVQLIANFSCIAMVGRMETVLMQTGTLLSW